MRLTSLLFRRNRMPNGNIFRGKERLIKQVEPAHIRRLREQFEIEEENMFYLRHPYLTEEQSHGHALALGKHQERRDRLRDETRMIFKDDVTTLERLLHLRVGEKWD